MPKQIVTAAAADFLVASGFGRAQLTSDVHHPPEQGIRKSSRPAAPVLINAICDLAHVGSEFSVGAGMNR